MGFDRVNIVVDVPDSLVARMRRAVGEGDYDDPQEFLRVAIENQIELEEGDPQEAKTLEEAFAELEGRSGNTAPYEEHAPTQTRERTREPESSSEPPRSADGRTTSREQDETLLARRVYDDLPTVALPEESRLDDGPLWGQYNRIFPVKLVVRALANELLAATGESDRDQRWVALPSVRGRIADVARAFGSEIAAEDELRGRNRGEKLSAGLPIGEDPEKSKDRFQTHFVGRLEQGNELTGAPPQLSFVDIADGRPQKIGLTDPGRAFAALQNPLLDRGIDADSALSNSERRFYVTHVRDERPEEYTAMQKVAQAIAEGDDRPDALTERVAYIDAKWSNSQAKTIRSGLTSRMYELGLLDRSRVGQRGIAYELTTDGEAFHGDGTPFADTRGDTDE